LLEAVGSISIDCSHKSRLPVGAMRAVAALSILALVTADVSLKDKGKCVVDGGEAASDLMDASIFIWGAKQRCGKEGMKVKCEIDIASAVQSIASMTNTILKVVGRCGHDFNPDCARASTRLVKAMAGLSSAQGGIKQKCQYWQQPVAGGAMVGGNLPGTNWMHGASALCVLDVKNTAKNLLKTVKSFVKLDHKCKDATSRKCASNSLKAAGAMAGMGEYLAAAIGDCAPPNKISQDAECAQESIMLSHHLVKLTEAGVEISTKCAPEEEEAAEVELTEVQVARKRLYEEDDVETSSNAGFANVVLGAFLPVTALVSFVVGRAYANRRARDEQTREVMSDHE